MSDDRPRQPSGAPTASKPLPGDGEAPPPGLHLVATPIGNLGDITLRALAVLRGAELIACEDTRVTGKLTARYAIATRRIAYNDHNAERVRPQLLERLRRGAAIALVSDAGTPLISDPGYKLVRAAIAEGLPVTMVPGAAAPLAALALSGLPTDRFLFAGFLPVKQSARRAALEELAAVPATLILFEAPRRLAASLGEMARVLGDRPAAIARELTKRHEEVRRDRLAALALHYATAAPKGEVVVVIGPPETPRPGASEEAAADLDAKLRAALAGASLRDAAAAVAVATGLPRRRVYARALILAGEERGR
ncbi:MAG: 16S rRNA (cytidine(1402)-2'-O)-methyltransferase [Alphaproteobacteria bacterium]|nr:16S rRNA (cytidine(1402)-2'-O)-methyltransferase [Alphaproteobacteria bacterium]